MSVAVFMLGCCLLEAIHEGTKAASRKAYNKRHTKRKQA